MDPPQSLIDEKPTGFLLKPSYSALKAYSSKSGRSYMAEKLSMEEDRKCLQDGEWIDLLRNLYFLFQKQGVALVALPDEGALGAWSSKTIDVYCLNNMPGIYKSAMVCDIDGLDAKQIPIKLGIKGSPLKVANTTLGLSSTQGIFFIVCSMLIVSFSASSFHMLPHHFESVSSFMQRSRPI